MSVHRLRLAGWRAVLLTAVFFALGIAAFVIWLNKPYPVVTSSVTFTKTSTDLPQRADTVVSWHKPKVCIPKGTTHSEIFAVGVRGKYGTQRTELVDRTFVINQDICTSPNPTAIIIPSNLPNGDYSIIVRACTENPTPRDRCIEVPGPSFTLIGQPIP